MRSLETYVPLHADAAIRFNEYYEANYRLIRRFATRLLNDPEEAAEVAQESFARLWQEIQAGVEFKDPRAWLYRVTANLATTRVRHWLRATTRQREVQESVRSWQRAPVDVERAAIYRQLVPIVLSRLPHLMRVCLVLYHDGLTGAEMAQVLGVKPSYVGTLVLRAHERFRREYERLGNSHGMHG